MKSLHLEKQYKYVAVPILFWGTLATINKLLLKSLDAMFVLAISSIVAFIFLFSYNLFTGKLKKMKTYNLADFIRMVVLGILGFFCYNLFYLFGIDVLPAQEAMILNYMWPAMIIIFSFMAESIASIHLFLSRLSMAKFLTTVSFLSAAIFSKS